MVSTNSSGNQSSPVGPAVRSALEGAALASAAAAFISWRLDGVSAGAARSGLFAAWAASTASAWALMAFRRKSFKAFLWAFGGGVFLRGAVLAYLMWSVWGGPYAVQSATLAAYAGGILAFLCLEYRQLNGI